MLKPLRNYSSFSRIFSSHLSSRHFCSLPPFGAVLQRSSSYDDVVKKFDWNQVIPKQYNIVQSACDRHASLTPNRPAIIYDRPSHSTQILTFKELQNQSNKLANALRHVGKLQKGDRVGILLSQRPETAISHMAIYRSGAIAVPLFELFGYEAIQYRLSASHAKILITDRNGLEKVLAIRKDLPELESIIIVDDDAELSVKLPENCYSFGQLLEQSKPNYRIMEDTNAEDPALIIFTSGTTGNPKGALHAHRVLLGHLPGIEFPHNFFPNINLNDQQRLLFYTPADWAWIGGLIDVLLPSLHYGVPVLAHRAPKFQPLEVAELMEKHQVTNTFMPPTALKLFRKSVSNKYSHLHSIGSGGESLGSELLQWGRDTYGLTINEFYGQTEANLLVGNCSVLHEVKPGSIGRAIPGRTIAIVDDNGNVLSHDQVGHIACKKGDPVMFLQYFENEKATNEKFIKDWMITGDLGKQDADGYFYFLGREDDVINSAGYRIGPSEVENCIIKHPAVLMCAVVGSPDPIRNEIVKAFCVLHQDALSIDQDKLAKEIQNFVKVQLAAHEYPRQIEFVKQLPMTTTGKIQRKILREMEYKKFAHNNKQ